MLVNGAKPINPRVNEDIDIVCLNEAGDVSNLQKRLETTGCKYVILPNCFCVSPNSKPPLINNVVPACDASSWI